MANEGLSCTRTYTAIIGCLLKQPELIDDINRPINKEDLGVKHYTDRDLHCCFNIYKRKDDGNLNKKKKVKLNDLYIEENRRTGHQINNVNDFDYGICTFGTGIIGKAPKYVGQYSKEMYFKITNDELREDILYVLKNTDYEKELCHGSSGQQNLTQIR